MNEKQQNISNEQDITIYFQSIANPYFDWDLALKTREDRVIKLILTNLNEEIN